MNDGDTFRINGVVLENVFFDGCGYGDDLLAARHDARVGIDRIKPMESAHKAWPGRAGEGFPSDPSNPCGDS